MRQISRSLTTNAAVVCIASLCIASFQAFAEGDAAKQRACVTILRPLVIQVEFPGTQRKITTASVKKKFIDELDAYIRDVSQNRVCIAGEVMDKWYKLPNPISNYWVTWQNLQANKLNLRNLVRDSIDAVDQDSDVSKYDFVIIALAATFNEWGNSGVSAYPGALGWKSDEILFTRSGRKVNRGIVAFASTMPLGGVFHDVAHVLGGVKDGKRVLPCLYDQDMLSLPTSRDLATFHKTFLDAQIHMGGWDTMSCNGCSQRPGPPGISSWTRLRLGWIESEKVRVVGRGENAQIILGPLEDASSPTMVIKIPITTTTYYLVENRQFIGHDKYLPEEGVLIMYADDMIGESRHGQGAVQLVNANPAVPHLESAAFDIGKNALFADEQNGVQIKLLKKNGRSYDILVEHRAR